MSEKRLVTLRLRAGTLTAEVPPEETEDVLTALARWYGKYWIAYVKDDAGRLWSWAYGDSRKEARERLSLDSLVEHLGTEQVRSETEVTYEVVLQPPRRTVALLSSQPQGDEAAGPGARPQPPCP
jgi:hypothetical protein